MKVVHINSFDGNGGAAKAAQRLHYALLAVGIKSIFLVNVKNLKGEEEVYTLTDGLLSRLWTLFLRALEVIMTKIFVKPIEIPYSLPLIGKSIFKSRIVKQADIIHLHWINQGFLSPKSIGQLKKLRKPIVWTLHDSNPFTGGCHVRYDCQLFEKNCGNCPVLKISGNSDLSNFFWKQKNKAYSGLPLHIIAPSRWMKDSAERSSLLGGKPIYNIPNTLNIDTFKPLSKQDRIKKRKDLGWEENSFIILSGFLSSKVSLHKGLKYFKESIVTFLDIYKNRKKRVKIVFFGIEPEHSKHFPFMTSFLGKVNDETKIAEYYSAADVFLTTSIEDNFPNMVLESLSCGTPVVAFRTGGIPDMVVHQKNGFIADFKDCNGIASGLFYILNSNQIDTLRENARNTVLSNFSPIAIAERHLELYHSLLKHTLNSNPASPE